MIINFAVLVPCILGVLKAPFFFSLFGFDEKIANLAHGYLMLAIPGMIAFVMFNTTAALMVGCGEFKTPGAI